LKIDLRVLGEKIPGHPHHGRLRAGQAQVAEKYGGNPFIHQDAPVLRIVAEFDDVKSAVGSFQKVGLRSAAHLPHQPTRINGHSWSNLRDYMNDDKEALQRPATPAGMNKDEVALELTRFIATTTGIGKSPSGAGFAGKAAAVKTPDEQVEALLQLYERCRASVGKQS
jgi:hypothetical protein